MNIDSLFKASGLSAGSNKRKLPENPTPEVLKKFKLGGSDSTVNQVARGRAEPRTVTMEEEIDEDSMNFAPGGDADYFAEEDDEGRFFGGGLTTEQKEILNIFDKAAGEGAMIDSDELSSSSTRRLLLQFERAVNKNQDQRSKYPDDPTKFIDSEADLDVAIKSLLPLAQAPAISYPELIKAGTLSLLIGLLSHENADIVIDVVELIHELTDEDVGNVAEDEEEVQSSEEVLRALVQKLVELSLLELLVDNLSRLKEEEESDKQGVFHILGIFENVLGFNPSLATDLVSKTKILPWLLNRIQASIHDENRGYAAELLAILLQNNAKNRLVFGQHDGVESVLKVLSQFRRRDPEDADETEFMENLFDALCSALNEPPIKDSFLSAEGPDLMVLMMKDKLQSSSRAIKTLDYAMSGASGYGICNVFIEALGLKTLFAAFMGRVSKKKKSGTSLTPEDTGHMLGIISSLFSNLGPDSPGRIRLLAKFVEANYEKVDKLLEIRDSARTRLTATERQILKEQQEQEAENEEPITDEDALYLRRLDGGLFTLQTVDFILAWIVLEDDGVRTHALQMLSRRNQGIRDIIDTLQIYHENVDEDSALQEEEDRPPSQKEILQGLVTALTTLRETT
ncbi:hypothetical protein AX16_003181 [Volvariella volvacea WC 439]|nr:hypothetical protein AX16_003181 [Volvariella volvacea WC 439]